LNLSKNEITSRGFSCIFDAIPNCKLKELIISQNPCLDQGV